MNLSNILHQSKVYLQHLATAGNAHALHAPFAYSLYTDVITFNPRYYAFGELEAMRIDLMANKRVIEVSDFGTGAGRNVKRSISGIAQRSLLSPIEGELLFRLVNHFQPKTILELGTSLGLSSLYMHKAYTQATIHTLEGCPNIAQIAQDNFQRSQASINVHVGDIDHTLPKVLAQMPLIDFAYLDANHSYEPTVKYFDKIIEHTTLEAVLVLDDIHWSSQMSKAWQYIIAHQRVSLTMDLFGLGLVFLSPKLSKQNFKLKFNPKTEEPVF